MIDMRDNRDVAYIVTSINRSFDHPSVIREEWNIVKAQGLQLLISKDPSFGFRVSRFEL
jgi:hypothetical protein